jgi:6-phosphogluconate dehydrogenase
MRIAMIGLGRMGANMARRLLRGGHEIVAYDPSKEALAAVVSEGATGAPTLAEMKKKLTPPRAVWVMVPSGAITQKTLEELAQLLDEGDVVIDGGNSNYKETQCRAAMFRNRRMQMVDCGTSGGIWGLTEGYSLMIGGDKKTVSSLSSVFKTLAPAPERGWGHVGPSGAGHFAKMIHNGIEYGMMQAFAEGFAILKKKKDLDFDLAQVAEIWRHGSVVRSWLLDLTARALQDNPQMEGIEPWVSDSGEGRWTVFESIDLDVPAPVLSLSLLARLRSRDKESYADRLLAAMRNQFGGHEIKKASV